MPKFQSVKELEDFFYGTMGIRSSGGQSVGWGELLKFPSNTGNINGSAASVTQLLKAATNITNLKEMIEAPTIDFSQMLASLPTFDLASFVGGKTVTGTATDPALLGQFRSMMNMDFKSFVSKSQTSLSNKSAVQVAQELLGLNATFVDAELKLMESIIQGAALAHHMEPLYFVALQNSLAARKARLEKETLARPIEAKETLEP